MASGGGENGGKEGSKEEKLKGEESKVYSRKSFNGFENSGKMIDSGLGKESQTESRMLGVEDGNLLQKSMLGVDSGDSSSQNRAGGNREVIRGNGMGKTGFPRLANRVRINLSMKSMTEVRELRTKLESELDDIRSVLKKIDCKEGRKAGSSVGKLKRAHSEVEPVDPPCTSRPLNQLNVSMVMTSPGQGGSANTGKEKRAPKVNKVMKPKETFQTPETKKVKSNGKKGHGGESAQSADFRKFPSHFVKSCGSLLDRLMKHKHGWVFNKPVDPVALGLHDYLDIIKKPMDLDTIKSRLSMNWYKSPLDFAEDVRLTFRNAMTYNPKGHDVYVMAEILLTIFEDKWAAIEAGYMRESRSHLDHGDTLPTPASKKVPPARMPPPEMRRELGRPLPNAPEVDPKAKTMNSAPVRSAAPRKPKAKEPNKREMTYGEKQKLSENLQSLPSEKLENVVQIIKKRNLSLCQNDDEVEVDIDNVDTETLWELDRFVTNYKKSLSKMKKQAELANQSTGVAGLSIEEKNAENPVPASVSASRETEMEVVSQSLKERQDDTKATKEDNGGTDLESSSGGSDSQSSSDIGSDV